MNLGDEPLDFDVHLSDSDILGLDMSGGRGNDVLWDVLRKVSIFTQGGRQRSFPICEFGEKLHLTKLGWMGGFWCILVVRFCVCVERVKLPG